MSLFHVIKYPITESLPSTLLSAYYDYLMDIIKEKAITYQSAEYIHNKELFIAFLMKLEDDAID